MYQWNPEDYALHSAPQERAAREMLDQLELHANDSVLDIGCGDGRHTAVIAARVPQGRVVGMDSSPDMVRYASKCFPPIDHPNLRFQLGDASALGFFSEFSVVFSNSVLHWITDHSPVVTGIAKALVPGGRCQLQMSGRGNFADVRAACDTVASKSLWRSAFVGFDLGISFHGPEEYRELLIGAGLIPEEVALIERDEVYPNREALVGFWRNVAHPYISRITSDRKALFVETVVDNYLTKWPAGRDGRIRVATKRLYVRARKPT